nr:MAG TPA: hypothetical protein [Caudoviricetes sp.]
MLSLELFISRFLHFLIYVRSAYIFICSRCRTLVVGLYLFTYYALQYQLTFRNLIDYLGIGITAFPDFARFSQ